MEDGIDPLIRGMIREPAQQIDTLMVDELRNVLFPAGRHNGLDLASMNIQRGRDHGLPDFNSVRKLLGLKGKISTRPLNNFCFFGYHQISYFLDLR